MSQGAGFSLDLNFLEHSRRQTRIKMLVKNMRIRTQSAFFLLTLVLLAQGYKSAVAKEPKPSRGMNSSSNLKPSLKSPPKPFISEKDMFAIEVLDRNKPEDR